MKRGLSSSLRQSTEDPLADIPKTGMMRVIRMKMQENLVEENTRAEQK